VSLRLMILPSQDYKNILLVRVPDDMGEQEAYRHATGVIAALEERGPGRDRGDVIEVLEEHGFEVVPHELGPELCC
jgi:hypothetical protein